MKQSQKSFRLVNQICFLQHESILVPIILALCASKIGGLWQSLACVCLSECLTKKVYALVIDSAGLVTGSYHTPSLSFLQECTFEFFIDII